MATVRLLYFASIRDCVGVDGEEVNLPETLGNLLALIAYLKNRGEPYQQAFAQLDKVRCAVDQQMTPLNEAFRNASEIAFFPPVTGG